MNRVAAAIPQIQAMMDAATSKPGFKTIVGTKFDRLDPAEYAAYQDAKSFAQANGTITHEEAQSVYFILTTWAERSLAEKYTVISLMGQLMLPKAA